MEREHSSSPETVILGVRRSSSHQWTESMDGMSRDSFELPFKPLLGLPEDCFLHVLRFLNVEQLCVAGGVNRQLRRLMDCDTLWRRHCLVDFGNDAEDIMEEYSQLVDSSEPAYYKRLYRSMIGFRVELRFWTGPRASEAIEVSNTKSTNIGRSRQNDICILQDEMVSRKHAQVAYKNKRYWLNDLGSINGTFINQSNSSGQVRLAASCLLLPLGFSSLFSCAPSCHSWRVADSRLFRFCRSKSQRVRTLSWACTTRWRWGTRRSRSASRRSTASHPRPRTRQSTTMTRQMTSS